ncbi:scarecrow-like protein 3 isoform X2 [Andrographis paniculata]|nr:scarecrow-like protein 3 isoform X2 [Andrographis paniculata]
MGEEEEKRGLCLIHLLVACANQVAAGSVHHANVGLEYISHLASPDGDTMQRIAAYFTEALADRMLKATWPPLHRALNSTRIHSLADQFLAHKLFFQFCPFLNLSHALTNQAILQAMAGERLVHIIDLNPFHPSQWLSLLRALRARPEGPPHLKITGVHEQKEVLDHVARRLNEEAEKLDIPFQFNSIVSRLENLLPERLPVKMGEAVAVASVLQLHTLLADGPNSSAEFLEKDVQISSPAIPPSKLSNFLTGLWSISPKIMVITEQEVNDNAMNLMDRVMESLNFYAALFDCLESTMPRASLERLKIEKMLFGEEIKNIIACEGVHRKTRHERLDKWNVRLEMAGFRKAALSCHSLMLARRLLQSWSFQGYKIRDENGSFMICWHDQPLFAVSAWRRRRGNTMIH